MRLLSTLCLMMLFATITQAKDDKTTEKVSRVGEYQGYTSAEYKEAFRYQSQYLTMRDSTKIAVDLYLPKRLKKGTKIPTVIYLTRYVRSIKAKFPFSLIKDPVLILPSEEEVKFFASYGYAVVVVDVRGSGASSGKRTMEFSPAEVKDGAEVVDWIISQPWSNGKVGTTGISYLGTTAELLLVNKHPAVKACIPRSNIFDLYNHIMFPNGVRQGPFVDVWGFTTRNLDNNSWGPFGKRAAKLVWGIHPVSGDKKNRIYKQALHDHKENFDVYKGLQGIEFRDDVHPELKVSSNAYSIHNNVDAIASSGTAIYRIGGWYDGGLQKSVTEGFMNTPNTEKVLLGPWDHGPANSASPHAKDVAVNFNIRMEMLRFFDRYLKDIDNGIDKEVQFYYYTVGAEHWDSTATWPLKEQQELKLYLSADKSLTTAPSSADGTISYKIDYTCTTDSTSRWNSMTTLYKHGVTHYSDRKLAGEKMLNFTAAPFTADVTMTGAPILDVYLSADAKDANVFCYIEDVGPDGAVTYVTEGQFRAIHRKVTDNTTSYKTVGPWHSFQRKDGMPLVPGETAQVSFDLLPISYRFEKGHSLRISIAGADCEHFDQFGEKPTELKVACTKVYPSSIVIPVDGSVSR